MKEVTRRCPDRFEYRKDRGWLWLQRVCFWVLKKIGAFAEETVEVFTRTLKQNDELVKGLIGMDEQRLRYAYEHRCRIYMGPEPYRALLMWCHDNGMRPFSLDAGLMICTPENRDGTWRDIPITVVPWMSGAILVPIVD